jgi:hypothetical protein
LADGRDQLRSELAGEHEWLRLEGAVEQPQHAERYLEVASDEGAAPDEGRGHRADATALKMCGDGRAHEVRCVKERSKVKGSWQSPDRPRASGQSGQLRCYGVGAESV